MCRRNWDWYLDQGPSPPPRNTNVCKLPWMTGWKLLIEIISALIFLIMSCSEVRGSNQGSRPSIPSIGQLDVGNVWVIRGLGLRLTSAVHIVHFVKAFQSKQATFNWDLWVINVTSDSAMGWRSSPVNCLHSGWVICFTRPERREDNPRQAARQWCQAYNGTTSTFSTN